jgi:hypothetical protein
LAQANPRGLDDPRRGEARELRPLPLATEKGDQNPQKSFKRAYRRQGSRSRQPGRATRGAGQDNVFAEPRVLGAILKAKRSLELILGRDTLTATAQPAPGDPKIREIGHGRAQDPGSRLWKVQRRGRREERPATKASSRPAFRGPYLSRDRERRRAPLFPRDSQEVARGSPRAAQLRAKPSRAAPSVGGLSPA